MSNVKTKDRVAFASTAFGYLTSKITVDHPRRQGFTVEQNAWTGSRKNVLVTSKIKWSEIGLGTQRGMYVSGAVLSGLQPKKTRTVLWNMRKKHPKKRREDLRKKRR